MGLQIKSKQRVADYGEVLTPPHIVNAMLDPLQQETARIVACFSDPFSKSSAVLCKVAKRLDKRLESHTPDQQKRINPITTHQLLGSANAERAAPMRL